MELADLPGKGEEEAAERRTQDVEQKRARRRKVEERGAANRRAEGGRCSVIVKMRL